MTSVTEREMPAMQWTLSVALRVMYKEFNLNLTSHPDCYHVISNGMSVIFGKLSPPRDWKHYFRHGLYMFLLKRGVVSPTRAGISEVTSCV